MRATYRIILLLAVVSLTLAASCGAQSSADGPSVKVRFRLMSWDAAVTDLNYAQSKKIIPVSMLPNSRSSFFEYQGADSLAFFREVTGPDGKPAAEVAATVPLSDFKERSLLLFFKSTTSPKDYTVRVIDDSDAAVPPGGYRFFNLTKFPLKVKCGGGNADVPPDQEETVLGSPAAGAQTIGMTVDVVSSSGTRHAYTNLLPYGRTTRTLVFVSQVPQTGVFEVKRLQEDIAAVPKPSPSPRR